jgi:intracellular septation protein
MKKNFLKSMMGSQLEMPDFAWQTLNVSWIGFALFLAATNGFVVTMYSEEDWINFKVWGYGFWIIFFIGQGLYIAPHLKSDDEAEKEPKA